jgi:hypothetical protein
VWNSDGSRYYSGTNDTAVTRASAGVVSFDTTTLRNGLGSIVLGGMTVGGGTKVTEIAVATGTLTSGSVTLANAAVTATSAVIATHLGSSVTNAGALLAYPAGTGTLTVKSTNSSDNDTFTCIVVNH